MLLSLWFWGRTINGRRSLISIGGVFPCLFILLPLLAVTIFWILQIFR
jgi:hypothetical protein